MSGAFLEIKVDDHEVKELFKQLRERLSDLTPAFKPIGEMLRTSVVRNFEDEGRPVKWLPSLRVKKQGGKTLTHTARLRNSIAYQVFADKVQVGTNVKYAAVHQFGFHGAASIREHIRRVKSRDMRGARPDTGKRGVAAKGIAHVKAHKRVMDIPARPFLMIQDEDWRGIKANITDYIMGKGGAN